MRLEFRRQTVHVLFSLFFIALFLLTNQVVVVITAAIAILLGAVFVASNSKTYKLARALLDRSKVSFPGKGAFLLGAGVLLTALLFPAQFIPAIIIVGIGDAFSTLIGVYWGKHKLFWSPKKSWEGSIAFLLCSAATLYVVTPYWIIGSLLLTIIESVDYSEIIFLDDNIIVPLAAAALMMI